MTARIITILTFLFFTTSRSQEQARPPHNKLMALPPSAYNFFHPIQNSCEKSNFPPLPLPATVESSLASESTAENNKGRSRGKFGNGGIAAIIFGFGLRVAATSMAVKCKIER
ncbi:hypothetical protein LXL04_013037 [Taraxacum kok-saghyz]